MLDSAGTIYRSYLCESADYKEAMKCQEQTKPREMRAGGLHCIAFELAKRPSGSTAGGGGRDLQEGDPGPEV